jgi:hypothetical protein
MVVAVDLGRTAAMCRFAARRRLRSKIAISVGMMMTMFVRLRRTTVVRRFTASGRQRIAIPVGVVVMAVLVDLGRTTVMGRFATSRRQRIVIPVRVVMVSVLVDLRRTTVMGRFAATGGKRGKTASEPIAIPLNVVRMMMTVLVDLRRTAMMGRFAASGGIPLVVVVMTVSLRRTAVMSRFAASGGQTAIPLDLRKRRHDEPQQGHDREKREEVFLHFEICGGGVFFFQTRKKTVRFVKERMRDKSARGDRQGKAGGTGEQGWEGKQTDFFEEREQGPRIY